MVNLRLSIMNDLLFPSEVALFQKVFGDIPFEVFPIPKSGSDRVYFRLFSPEGGSVILCRSENVEENKVFIRLCLSFRKNDVNVPEILAVAPDFKAYLQTDLGSRSLFDIVTEKVEKPDSQPSLTPNARHLVKKTLRSLVEMQSLPPAVWEREVGFPPLASDLIDYDFQYFLTQFVEAAGVDFNRRAVKCELSRLGELLAGYPEETSGFMFRDFQSRNVMVCPEDIQGNSVETPYFIDFQSGRRGPCVYDLVSFVFQAKAAYTETERKDFIDFYVACFSETAGVGEEILYDMIPPWALFRVMQVLGAYGLRGLKEGKQHFIESIPYGVRNLHDLLSSPRLSGFPALLDLSFSLIKKYPLRTQN